MVCREGRDCLIHPLSLNPWRAEFPSGSAARLRCFRGDFPSFGPVDLSAARAREELVRIGTVAGSTVAELVGV